MVENAEAAKLPQKASSSLEKPERTLFWGKNPREKWPRGWGTRGRALGGETFDDRETNGRAQEGKIGVTGRFTRDVFYSFEAVRSNGNPGGLQEDCQGIEGGAIISTVFR